MHKVQFNKWHKITLLFSLKLGEVVWTQSCTLAWRNFGPFGFKSDFDGFTCKKWFQHFYWVKIKTLPCQFQNVIFLLCCLAGLQFLDQHLDILLQKTCQIRSGFTYKTKSSILETNHSFNSLLAVRMWFSANFRLATMFILERCGFVFFYPSVHTHDVFLWPPGILICSWTDFIHLYTP